MSQSTERPHLVVVAPPKKARYHRRVSKPAEEPEAETATTDEADDADDEDETPARAASSG